MHTRTSVWHVKKGMYSNDINDAEIDANCIKAQVSSIRTFFFYMFACLVLFRKDTLNINDQLREILALLSTDWCIYRIILLYGLSAQTKLFVDKRHRANNLLLFNMLRQLLGMDHVTR